MTSQLIISQNVVINGRVTDFSTKTAISNIHVFTSDLKSGTVSDNNGNFRISLSPDYSNKRLCFSGIGYQTDSVDIEKIRNIFDVKLIPDIYQLKEVFIMPDSTLLTLLRKAYHKISDNYPDQPTMYESFYRESIQNEHKKQVDFVEAVLSVYKDPYDKPTSLPGQVRINKSRKKQARDIGVLYIGGPFLPIEGDVVLTRNKFINPYFFKDYRYEFNGVKVQGRYEYYEILYESLRKENDSGLILIERNSLAYASFHLKKKSIPFLSRMKNAEIEENVIYEEKDGKWFLKYYTYSNVHTDKLNNNPRYATIEYIAINIKTRSVAGGQGALDRAWRVGF